MLICDKLSQFTSNRTSRSVANRIFLQLTLQCSSVHAEGAGRCGDIAVVLVQNTLNMLPLESLNGWAPGIAESFFRSAFATCQRCNDIVHCCGLGKVLLCSFLDRFDGCCNAAVAGQNNCPGFICLLLH